MKQLDDLAANGGIHHYKIDTGLFLLLFHGKHLSQEHLDAAQAYRDTIGKMPTKVESALIAKGALDLLNAVRAELPGPTYSAIYQQFNEGLQDASA